MGVLRPVAAGVRDHDLDAEGAAAGDRRDPALADRPHERTDRHREVLPGVPVGPPRAAAAEGRGQLIRPQRRHPRARGGPVRLGEPDRAPAGARRGRGVGLRPEPLTGPGQLALDVLFQLREFAVVHLEGPPLRRCLPLVRREPGLRTTAPADRVPQGVVGLRHRALPAQQSLRVVREEHPRGEGHVPAAPVLGARDPSQVLVQDGELPPLADEPLLQLPGARPLGLGRAAALLVLPRRRGRVLVQPRHLGTGPRVGAAPGGAAPGRLGGPGHEHGERAQQRRQEPAGTAG
ncbi:hypothetical protein GCM10020295_42400 [Streptomyces cinereospinus]